LTRTLASAKAILGEEAIGAKQLLVARAAAIDRIGKIAMPLAAQMLTHRVGGAQ
jgi:hypothetical protein